MHAIKFQSVVTPTEIVANLYDPVEGCRHDSDMLGHSGLLQQLEQHSYNWYQERMCLYGDPGYPLRVSLQRSFANPSPDQLRYNKAMSQSRVAVEWVLVISQIPLPFLILKKPSKPVLALLGRCTFVVHSCNYARSYLCGCATSKLFCLDTPNLVDCFQ